MKIATYRGGGERRVGVVDERRQVVSPFDIPEAEALLGLLAIIDRHALPRVLSPMPLREADRWISSNEQFWGHQLDSLASYVERDDRD